MGIPEYGRNTLGAEIGNHVGIVIHDNYWILARKFARHILAGATAPEDDDVVIQSLIGDLLHRIDAPGKGIEERKNTNAETLLEPFMEAGTHLHEVGGDHHRTGDREKHERINIPRNDPRDLPLEQKNEGELRHLGQTKSDTGGHPRTIPGELGDGIHYEGLEDENHQNETHHEDHRNIRDGKRQLRP